MAPGGEVDQCGVGTAISPWERFDLIDQGAGKVALRARADNRYVTADNAGSSPLIANRSAIGRWSRFDLQGLNRRVGELNLHHTCLPAPTVMNLARIVVAPTASLVWQMPDLADSDVLPSHINV